MERINTLVSDLMITLSEYHKITNILSANIVWPFVKAIAFVYFHVLCVVRGPPRMDEQLRVELFGGS